MSHIHIADLPFQQNADCLPTDIQQDELHQIKGGLDPDSGGLAIIGLGISAFAVGSVTAPLIGTAGVVIGLGILFRNSLK